MFTFISCDKTDEKKDPDNPDPIKVEEEITEGCSDSEEEPVTFEEATNWILWWGEFFAADCTNGESPEGGFWPVQFATDMSSFQDLIKNNNEFRVYYAMCNALSTGNTAHLLAAPLDNSTCNPIIGDNVYSFPTSFPPDDDGYPDCSPEGATTTTIPKDTAINWTANFRNQFGISTTNDQSTLPCSDITYTIPLAFTFDKASFEANINQEAETLYVKLGIDTIHTASTVVYEFKLLFDTAGESGVGEGIDYVDFASPCPQACVGVDPLL